jgi:uncharacterized protein YlxP (DUF503 family)
MVIGAMTLELDIPAAYSLKEKRAVLNRVRDRTRQKFNVSIAEIDDLDVWNHACVAVVTVSNQHKHANQVLSKVLELMQTLPDCEVEDVAMEFL